MRRVKFGIIGLGWFGEKHCEALSGIPQVELFALCTRTESRLQELAKRFNVSHFYTDYNELLANADVEAVNVVTM
ncbi:MAG: Gfo/Idh/MocA family protein, partial [Planctomycetota bacterium]